MRMRGTYNTCSHFGESILAHGRPYNAGPTGLAMTWQAKDDIASLAPGHLSGTTPGLCFTPNRGHSTLHSSPFTNRDEMVLTHWLGCILSLITVVASAQNPILPGFNPDPSIVRVGRWYYLATSSFEYWPGIPLYRSKDLVNWDLFSHALTRPDLAQLYGVPTGAGRYPRPLSLVPYSEMRCIRCVGADALVLQG